MSIHRTFLGMAIRVEAEGRHLCVEFSGQPGCFMVPDIPTDLHAVVRLSLHSGLMLEVTYESGAIGHMGRVLDLVPHQE